METLKSATTYTCVASTELEKQHEDAKIHKFHFGLDEICFNTIQSQIIDEEPLLTSTLFTYVPFEHNNI